MVELEFEVFEMWSSRESNERFERPNPSANGSANINADGGAVETATNAATDEEGC
jgi:hypothetical protein